MTRLHAWRIRAVRAAGLALAVAAACRLDDLTTRPPGVPGVQVALSDVTDSATLGQHTPHTMPIAIAGPAGSALDWTAQLATPAAWVTVTPANGHAAGGHDTVSVTTVAAGLAPGTYADTVLISASGDTAPARVSVRLVVSDCATTRFAAGSTVSDALTISDCQPPDQAGRFARVYLLTATPGDSVSLSAASSAFAPFLAIADSANAAQPLRQGLCGAAPAPCLRYVRLTGSGPWRVMVTSGDPGDTGAFTLLARQPTPPQPAISLRQLHSDGSTAVAPGATITESTIILAAVVADSDPADSVRFEVELRPATQPFQGTATTTGAALPQGPASVRLSGLGDGSYRWQARVTDQTGRAGSWTAFGPPSGGADFSISTPASALAFIAQPSSTTAGSPLSPAVSVTARKAGGTVDTAFSGSITLSLSGGGTLGGTTTRTAVRGEADFADLHVDRTGSGYALVAQASGLAAATSATFSISPASATRLIVTTQPGDTPAGSAITPSLAVGALDAYGNAATGFSGAVTVSIVPGTGTAGASLTGTRTVTASNGAASFADLHIDRSGSGYQLAVSATGVTGAQSAGFRITPGSPSVVVIAVQPSDTRSGQAIAPAIQVAVRDAFGNVVTGYAGAVTVALGNDPNGGLSTLSGTRSVTPVNGVATFADLSINLAGSGFTLRFTTGGLPTTESTAFNVSL